MKLEFLIEYKANFNENLFIKILKPQVMLVPLTCSNDKYWQGSIKLNGAAFPLLEYIYEVKGPNGLIRREPLRFCHQLALNAINKTALIRDAWLDRLHDSFLYTDAFSHNFTAKAFTVKSNSLNLRTRCCLKLNCSLFVTGNCSYLGNWDPHKALPLTQTAPNYFTISLNKNSLPDTFEYKFIAVDQKTGEIFWERGFNRQARLTSNQTEYLPESETTLDTAYPKTAGTAIPVFSLRSNGSCGVGDFGDLKLFIDWAVKTGQKLVQILPINDTTITKTWTDSYPYRSISIYALHPMYIDLRQVETLKQPRLAKKFNELRVKLNALEQIDYEAVNETKIAYLRHTYAQSGSQILKSDDFKRFFDRNQTWLEPYAAFSYLRDTYGTADFSRWQERSYDPEKITALCAQTSTAYTKIAFYYYLQYLLHLQLSKVSAYAQKHGIILKGDIPIGISRNSVEAWEEPFYFNMKSQAGAPPDPFAADGQNWGFPTYNWDRMAEDGYSWWLKRFNKMSEYFGAYRIDHILGFFRIWDIPDHAVRGLLGNFVPSLPLSVEEIESYGLKFQYDFMTRPFINEDLINRLFGEDAQLVKAKFVRNLHHDIYSLNDEFLTERQVEAYFKDKTDAKSVKLRNGLYSLISDVLFIPDRNRPNLYHPRIAVLNDYVFSRLQPDEKAAFTRLYNDYYYRRHNEFWYREAMKKLPPLINSTAMLPCGEDLGMVPECVPWVMNDLDILSLEIERMPKTPGLLFNDTAKYPVRSVCTTGTHDMATLRMWWEEDKELTQKYFNTVLHHDGPAPAVLSGKLCEEIITRHLQSPSILCVLPLQDWLAVDERLRLKDCNKERINIPADTCHYWRYRMHLSLESLIADNKFNDKIASLILAAGRN